MCSPFFSSLNPTIQLLTSQCPSAKYLHVVSHQHVHKVYGVITSIVYVIYQCILSVYLHLRVWWGQATDEMSDSSFGTAWELVKLVEQQNFRSKRATKPRKGGSRKRKSSGDLKWHCGFWSGRIPRLKPFTSIHFNPQVPSWLVHDLRIPPVWDSPQLRRTLCPGEAGSLMEMDFTFLEFRTKMINSDGFPPWSLIYCFGFFYQRSATSFHKTKLPQLIQPYWSRPAPICSGT